RHKTFTLCSFPLSIFCSKLLFSGSSMAKDGPNWDGLLKWSLSHADGTRPTRQLSEEDRKWFMEAMQSQTLDVVKRMKEITLVMQTPEQVLVEHGVTPDDIEDLLDELQEHVESIDMANDLHSIGGLVPLLGFLKNSHANIRAKAADVVSTIVQNNPRSQELVMEANGLESLLSNFISDTDVHARTQALSAISSLIRHNKPGVTAFKLANGYAGLRDAMASDSVRFQRKALNLLQYLLQEDDSDRSIATGLGFPRLRAAGEAVGENNMFAKRAEFTKGSCYTCDWCWLGDGSRWSSSLRAVPDIYKEVKKMEEEDECVENKQSTAASCSSVSEGSGGGGGSSFLKSSPAVASPPTVSPTHRRTSGPIRRAKGGWTTEEDETLRQAVCTYNAKSWKKIAEFFPDRTEVQCLHRWQKVLNPDLIKGPWTQEEDEKIVELVKKYGPAKWSTIAKSLEGRIGKQCRESCYIIEKGKENKSEIGKTNIKKKEREGNRVAIYIATELKPTKKKKTNDSEREMEGQGVYVPAFRRKENAIDVERESWDELKRRINALVNKPTEDTVEVAVVFVRECGALLLDLSPRRFDVIFDVFRRTVQEGDLEFRRSNFEGYPAVRDELDLMDSDEKVTHVISLYDESDPETSLDVYKPDPEFHQNERKYEKLKRNILGEEVTDEQVEQEDDEDERTLIQDHTETDLVSLRRTIYQTIMSTLNFEEAGHKLLQIRLEPGQEMELCVMILECCAEEKTYRPFYGHLAQRFCLRGKTYRECFENLFVQQYATVHRLETNKLKNVAMFFAHVLATDALPWCVLANVSLTEEDTTSSSRIFLKILFQELSEQMGMRALNEKLQDPTMEETFESIFPKDHPKNMRFSIDFFTSIGLGDITEKLRQLLIKRQRINR
ncbi:unnamed protein product, partial [Brassica napus]